MADNDVEKKNIARLSFDINDAVNGLNTIQSKIEKLSKTSENEFEKIGKSFKKNFDMSEIIDINSLSKQISNVSNITEKQAQEIVTKIMKEEYGLTAKRKKEQLEVQSHNSKINANILQDEAKKASKLELIDAQKNATIEKQNNQHQNKLEEINQRQLKSTQTIADKIANYAKTYLIYQGFNQLKQTAGELINEMVDVEYQMVQIDRVLNDNSLNIDNYRDKLIQLAYDYGNSFDNVADITLRLAQAGFDADESLALTEKTLLALNTAELNATQATSDMVAVMSQWGLMTGDARQKAENYGKIIDRINKVADNFPTTSEDIMNALKKTSSAFNLAGASIDETIAMITAAEVASQRGGKAIGTALSNIIQQLKDAGRMTTMESLGIDVYTDATKTEFNSIIDIISQLSEKMQQLKDTGKENSAEMQNLLEVFTVFRRNIGAGLLGEMAGEDSTYAKVLEYSINSVGYSLQENEKHMKTAKAAQEQFNATLLQLKTEVWDNGVEDMFRSLLLIGNDVAKSISWLVKTFGSVPTAIGAATLAFTAFNKQLKTQVSYNLADGFSFTGSDFINKIKKAKEDVHALQLTMKGVTITGHEFSESFKEYVNNIGEANVSTKGYIASLVKQKAATIAAEVATVALNAAISMGISLAITAVLTLIDNLIHAEEKYIEKIEEEISITQEKIDTLENERETLEDLISEYEELSKKKNRTPEEENKIYELQLKINEELKKQGEHIDFSSGKYEDQLKKLKEITLEIQKQTVEEKKKLAQETASKKVGVSFNAWESTWQGKTGDIERTLRKAGVDLDRAKTLHLGKGTENINFGNFFNELNFNEQLSYLTEWKEKLEEAGETGSKAYEWVAESLETLNERQREAMEATEDYYREAAKLTFEKMFDDKTISNVEQFKEVLKGLQEMQVPEEFQAYKDTLIDLYQNKFSEFANEAKLAAGDLSALDSVINVQLTSLQNLSDQYAMLRDAQDEYNKTGEMTIGTLQNLINNDLLQYLSLQNGQLQINAQSLSDAGEAAKKKAIQELQDAAALDIQYVATGNLNKISNIAKGAIAGVGNNAKTAGTKMQSAVSMANNFAASLQNVINASKGELGEGVDPNTFQKQANAIVTSYANLAKNISAINIKTASYSPKKATSTGGSKTSSTAKSDAKKAAEEEYKAKLDAFKDFVSERERLEQRWVSKEKELGLLSTNDYLYITQQRIKRYQKYLAQVKKMTWLNKKDRVALEKEYKEKIEDLQVDYLGYLKDKLDEQIDALKEANEKKIDLIKEEADERIAALRKVEDENDRIRAKEEYLKKRQEHLDDISYWEQRTGREAQEALLEARKNLKELDEEWKQQLDDWSIEDQIAAIEAERDAQIAAIEEAQQKQIDAWTKTYEARVKLFGETGKIIYDNTVIQSKNLYNAYKTNFVDPLSKDLANINKTTTKSSSSKKKEYDSYKIKSGDTLSAIAKKYNTTVSKIMAANPSIKNKNLIYAGDKIKIPKFHEGGIVGGYKEGFALLKPNEVVLKPEWAEGINRLAKIAKQNNGTTIGQNTVVEVKGDLVRIDANIKNKTDAEYLTKKIEKVLTNKFNIKK